MSEAANAKEVATPEPGDRLLRVLVEIVDETSLEIGVTVQVHGAMISGTLVSAQSFMRDTAKQVLGDGDKPVREQLAALWSGIADQLEAEAQQRRDATDEPAEQETLPGYLHLKDATRWDPAQPTPAGLMRCRVASVDAWTVGTLSGR